MINTKPTSLETKIAPTQEIIAPQPLFDIIIESILTGSLIMNEDGIIHNGFHINENVGVIINSVRYNDAIDGGSGIVVGYNEITIIEHNVRNVIRVEHLKEVRYNRLPYHIRKSGDTLEVVSPDDYVYITLAIWRAHASESMTYCTSDKEFICTVGINPSRVNNIDVAITTYPDNEMISAVQFVDLGGLCNLTITTKIKLPPPLITDEASDA